MDILIFGEIGSLKQRSNPNTALIIGGNGLSQFKNESQKLRAVQIDSLMELRPMLADLASIYSPQKVVFN